MKPIGFVEIVEHLASDPGYLCEERYELSAVLRMLINDDLAFEVAKRHPGIYGELVREAMRWAYVQYWAETAYAHGIQGDLFPSDNPRVLGMTYLVLDAVSTKLLERANR